MTSKKLHILIGVTTLLLFAGHPKVCAQFDVQTSQYMLAPGGFNPAVAGEGSEMLLTLQNRQQWVGIDGAPSTLLVNVSMPFVLGNRKHGFGLIIEKESIGLFSTQLLQLQYAYRRKLFDGDLSLGFQGGVLQEGFDGSGIYIPKSDYHTSTGTDIPTTALEGTIPDFWAGIWYRKLNYYAGFSVSHLLESSITLTKKQDQSTDKNPSVVASRTYYLTGGYNILLTNPLYTLQPSFLIKSDLVATQIDLSGRVIYKEKYWGGLGWRYQDGIILMAGMKLQQGVSLGYSYDVPAGAVAGFSKGSHELFLSYSKKIGTATVSKKQKSVRIL